MDSKDLSVYEIQSLITDLSKYNNVITAPIFIRIKNAKEKAEYILSQYIDFKPLPEYEAIYSWLSDNRGRGLLMCGNCGRGKSLFGRLVIPAILLREEHLICNVVNSVDLGKKKEIFEKKIIYVDDIGRENESFEYGNKIDAVSYLIDKAEESKKLLILSTNLTLQELRDRYGDRIIDRLKAITYVVAFKGESMRK